MTHTPEKSATDLQAKLGEEVAGSPNQCYVCLKVLSARDDLHSHVRVCAQSVKSTSATPAATKAKPAPLTDVTPTTPDGAQRSKSELSSAAPTPSKSNVVSPSTVTTTEQNSLATTPESTRKLPSGVDSPLASPRSFSPNTMRQRRRQEKKLHDSGSAKKTDDFINTTLHDLEELQQQNQEAMTRSYSANALNDLRHSGSPLRRSHSLSSNMSAQKESSISTPPPLSLKLGDDISPLPKDPTRSPEEEETVMGGDPLDNTSSTRVVLSPNTWASTVNNGSRKATVSFKEATPRGGTGGGGTTPRTVGGGSDIVGSAARRSVSADRVVTGTTVAQTNTTAGNRSVSAVTRPRNSPLAPPSTAATSTKTKISYSSPKRLERTSATSTFSVSAGMKAAGATPTKSSITTATGAATPSSIPSTGSSLRLKRQTSLSSKASPASKTTVSPKSTFSSTTAGARTSTSSTATLHRPSYMQNTRSQNSRTGKSFPTTVNTESSGTAGGSGNGIGVSMVSPPPLPPTTTTTTSLATSSSSASSSFRRSTASSKTTGTSGSVGKVLWTNSTSSGQNASEKEVAGVSVPTTIDNLERQQQQHRDPVAGSSSFSSSNSFSSTCTGSTNSGSIKPARKPSVAQSRSSGGASSAAAAAAAAAATEAAPPPVCQVRFCHNCGQKFVCEDAHFCAYCGTKKADVSL